MNTRLLTLSTACMAAMAMTCQADTINWGFSPSDPAPYVVTREHSLQHSITLLIGQAVGQRMDSPVHFIAVPNNRLDEALAQQRIEVICNTQPAWLANASEYLWSHALYSDSDVIVTRSEQPAPTSLASMQGFILGTTLGYQYAPALTQAFAQGHIHRHDVRDLNTRLKMLRRQRLDALVDLRRAVLYQIRQNNLQGLHVSAWPIERFAMQCALSPNQPQKARKLVNAINSLVDDGSIQRLLSEFD